MAYWNQLFLVVHRCPIYNEYINKEFWLKINEIIFRINLTKKDYVLYCNENYDCLTIESIKEVDV